MLKRPLLPDTCVVDYAARTPSVLKRYHHQYDQLAVGSVGAKGLLRTKNSHWSLPDGPRSGQMSSE